MAWCQPGNKPLSEPMLTQFTDAYTVYPKKYAHGFCFAVLCCGYTLTDFPISIRLTSLALWQSNDCPSASKATLMNMDKYFMWIGKTPVRIILWCPITKMLIKACFLVQPQEQEGMYQKCCISLCSKMFINHFYQMKASPECLNILAYCTKYWVDRLRRTIGRKFKQEYFINKYVEFATIFYTKLPTSTAALLVVNSMNH